MRSHISPMTSYNCLLSALCLVVGVGVVKGLTITSDPGALANKTFTHVVVGGGTAGLTVASRLAEEPLFNVAVIEAGPDAQNDSLVNDPANDETVTSVYRWAYLTTPQGSDGVNLTMLQGKVLGGSSSINGMEWTRATSNQYDALERLGNKGWNSTSMFKYMKKAEGFHPPSSSQLDLGATWDPSPSIHNTTGPVSASFPNPYSAAGSFGTYISSLLAYFAPVSLVQNPDVCSGTPNGAARIAYSIIPGSNATNDTEDNVRASSARSYVYPFLDQQGAKENLVILVGHQAIGIVWGDDDADGNATVAGVRFVNTPEENGTVDGAIWEVAVRKEVVVASGAIGSPHFLELSGIGNATILSSMGIPVKIDLPSIGTNLQDQPLISGEYNSSASVPPSFINTTNAPNVGVSTYLTLGQVLGFENGNSSVQGLLNSVEERAKEIVAGGGFANEDALKIILTMQAESMLDDAPIVEMSWGSLGGIIGSVVWNLLPQSRGTTHIQSSNPAVLPRLNPAYLRGPAFDLYLISNATKSARAVSQTPPLSDIVTTELVPGLSTIPLNASDGVWQEWILANVQPVIHPIGTVAMLPREMGGAVGSDLKLYGTSNVRVVDSSIIPIQLSAHLSATVYGIAEKAADIIKGCD